MFFQRDPSSPERDRRLASVAVVPFDSPPLDPEQAQMARGFLEDVVSELARVADIEVLAARTSLALTPAEAEPRRLAEAYGVTHLLDTAVRPGPDGLQIRANLIEAASGRLAWSHRYAAPRRQAGEVLEDIATQVAANMTIQVRMTRQARARARPVQSLVAQDIWLRGLDLLRLTTPEGDEEARRLFERALSIDPTYARAYAGLSLSHFKRWHWRHATLDEAEGDRLSVDYIRRAEALDDLDPVVQVVAGRLQVYRRQFPQGRYHLERAETLCPSEADCLMHMAPMWAYLGEAEKALALSAKAFRLNPLHEPWYYFVGFMPHFIARRVEEAAAILERSPPAMLYDEAALLAACYAQLGRVDEARAQIPKYLHELQHGILGGRAPEPGEPLQHMLDSNPFARDEDREFLLEGLAKAGLAAEPAIHSALPAASASVESGQFTRRGGLWEVSYAGRTVVLADAKGCADLALLLSSPRERIHCMDLAGRVAEGHGGEAMDARARAECQRRIQDLQADLAEAERDNDFARTERLSGELDALVDQLAAAVGLGGRRRRLGDPAEKARTAVTWRIRSAIKKIAAVHPQLGRHLQGSIRTGSFCAYEPETHVQWAVG
jgi:TolB-like protein